MSADKETNQNSSEDFRRVFAFECCVRQGQPILPGKFNFHKISIHASKASEGEPINVNSFPTPIFSIHTNFKTSGDGKQTLGFDHAHVHPSVNSAQKAEIFKVILENLEATFRSLNMTCTKITTPFDASQICMSAFRLLVLGNPLVIASRHTSPSDIEAEFFATKLQLGPIDKEYIPYSFWCTESTCKNDDCGGRINAMGETDHASHQPDLT